MQYVSENQWKEPVDLHKVDLHACGWTCSPKHPPYTHTTQSTDLLKPNMTSLLHGKAITGPYIEVACTRKLYSLWRLHMNSVSATDESLHFLALRATQLECVKPGGGWQSSQELPHEDEDMRYDLSSTRRHAVLGNVSSSPPYPCLSAAVYVYCTSEVKEHHYMLTLTHGYHAQYNKWK